MSRILKVQVEHQDDPGVIHRMPLPARVVHVGFQDGQVTSWIEVDDRRRVVPFALLFVGTGEEAPEGWSYVGTAQESGHPLVWHVYRDGAQA